MKYEGINKLYAAVYVAIAIAGAGKYSIDYWIYKRWK
jgi:uncharacterized membrane protein YphA (DoxX/SURF4 family)